MKVGNQHMFRRLFYAVYTILASHMMCCQAESDRVEAEDFLEIPKYQVVLDPIHRTKYYPQVQLIAPVIAIHVKTGDSFKKGDLLLQLDSEKFQAFYLKTQAIIEKAQAELQAKERLYRDGNASYFDYMEAKSNVVAAQAEGVFAKKNLEATAVIAPYDGKVSSITIEKYELPLENKEMIELINDHTLIGKALLPSSLVHRVKVGDPVEIVLDENKKKLQARITRIAAVIEPSSSTLKIEVNVDNTQGKLMSGMSGFLILK